MLTAFISQLLVCLGDCVLHIIIPLLQIQCFPFTLVERSLLPRLSVFLEGWKRARWALQVPPAFRATRFMRTLEKGPLSFRNKAYPELIWSLIIPVCGPVKRARLSSRKLKKTYLVRVHFMNWSGPWQTSQSGHNRVVMISLRSESNRDNPHSRNNLYRRYDS